MPDGNSRSAVQPSFATYEEFFVYYLQEHRDPRNRLMHATGTSLGLVVAAASVVTHHYWGILLWLPIGYGFAWTGHFLLEGNKPATFGHPVWSLLSDFRMLGLMATGKLQSWLERAGDSH